MKSGAWESLKPNLLWRVQEKKQLSAAYKQQKDDSYSQFNISRGTFGSVFFQEAKMKTKGAIVWNYKEGWTSTELEIPTPGKIAIFIDYPDDDLNMPIVEPEVEEILSSLGYIGEGRYIGENDILNPLETKIVTYVGAFYIEEMSQHLSILNQTKIPLEWFYTLNSEGNIAPVKNNTVPA
jgi:hypothetical protein